MIKVSITPEGTYSVELTPEFVTHVATWIRRQFPNDRDPYLDYSMPHAEKYYGNSRLRWLEAKPGQPETREPYELIYDYRKAAPTGTWGTYEFTGDYAFPPELVDHREGMKKRMESEGKLKKGDNPAPRVLKASVNSDGSPHLALQHARYYDQVGTNLTLDHPLPSSIQVAGLPCSSVREWDIAQAGQNRSLPSYELSRLANTIGVAIGATARREDGTQVLLRQLRGPEVAIYPNQWQVPVAFSLSYDPRDVVLGGDLKQLIQLDFVIELGQETALEPKDFSPLRPIAFCRDLVRGGKPQFFLEMTYCGTFEDLQKRAKDTTNEFRGKPKSVSAWKTERKFSPELKAFLALKAMDWMTE